MQRFMRSVLVALLVAMLSFSPSMACHYCGGYGGGGYYSRGGCGGYYVGGCYDGGYYDSGYGNSCCGGEVVVVSEGCGGCGGCGDCGCGEEGVVTEQAPSDKEPQMRAPEPPLQEDQEDKSMPSTVHRPMQDPAPALPPGPLPGIPETETAPLPTTPPATEPMAEPAPLPEEPVAPPTDTSDDLFGEPMTEPAAEPATPPADADDDLFGEPAEEETPLPAEEPATPSEADDFFSSPAEEPATDAAPATPAEEPASESLDDDLFGEPAAEEEPAEEPAEEEATPPAESDETDDLFGNSEAILEMPGGLASSELRQWVDNTGDFSCRGRMLRMLDGKVQLVKDNGRTTTVPLARLSQGDLEFVNRQASAQKAETLGKTAQTSTGWSN